MQISPEKRCPCRNNREEPLAYASCCGPYLARESLPATAEKLMRSRYSAYALGDLEYIKYTWHPSTLPDDLRLVPGQLWIGLQIKRVENGLNNDNTGSVEFVAKSKRNGKAHRIHEVSEFEKIDGRWVYVRGDYSSK